MKLPWKKEERAQNPQTEEGFENESQLIRAIMSGEKIEKQKALEIPAVVACIDKIAASVAAVDFKLYKVVGGIPKMQNDNRTKLLNAETGDTLDSIQFWKALVQDYFLDKGGYAYINWRFNEIESLHYVEADKISFQHNADPIFKKYMLLCNGRRYMPHEFLKIIRHTKNGWKGTSLIDENNVLLWVSYAELKLEGNQVSKGGNKKGFILSEKKLEKHALDAVKEAFRSLYSNNSDNVVVLNNGMKFQESSNTAVEMQLKEMKEANAKAIYRIFQIPPSVMDGNASDDDNRLYYESAVKPVLDAIKAQINRLLLLESEKDDMYFDYDMSSLMKGDVKSRYEAYKTGLESGFITVDEVRRKENEEPIGLPFVKLNLADVLYDPTTKTVYAINTDKSTSIEDLKKGGKQIDESGIES
ncbi:phage portal protein [Emergencia sp.]|uniref:phage portal protein n=1 Tax=Emergencia sp. TaxID=1926557 RepID=UPI003AF0A93F